METGVVVTLGASSAPKVKTHRDGHDWSTQAHPHIFMPLSPVSVQQRKYDLHYRIALVVNYLGHCVSVAALVAAFLLFLALR